MILLSYTNMHGFRSENAKILLPFVFAVSKTKQYICYFLSLPYLYCDVIHCPQGQSVGLPHTFGT